MAVIETQTTEITRPGASSPMRVRKRDGHLEPVDLNRIVAAVERASAGLDRVDPLRVATRTIAGLVDGSTTSELDATSIRTAAGLIGEEPNYSRVAARLLDQVIVKEVENQGIHSFSDSVAEGARQGLIAEATAQMVVANSEILNLGIDPRGAERFEFFGAQTLYDRYLLRHPESRQVIETPQYAFMRVACGLSHTPEEALGLYGLMSRLEYMPSSPTLFNSGTSHPQMSSCYLLDSPLDELDAIYSRYGDVARLSKYAGGIGLAFSRVRSRGSLIKGTNGLSNGIIPWLKTLDSSVAAVNQGGRRKGAACVYLETWHRDIEDFLEMRDNTGDEARRARNINLANWIPDLFMERVEKDWVWSLFDPKVVPHLVDLYGADFEQAYAEAEAKGLYEKQVPARQLYSKMMRTLAQTGNGWMTFKDPANERCNQTGEEGATVHLSNLCTEILQVTDQENTAVCNLGSINLASIVVDREVDGRTRPGVDLDKLGGIVRTAVPFLDRVIDINFYPTPEAANSNAKWRPVGLGLMGLADVFFRLGLPFDSPEARKVSRDISEEIYFHALSASVELAKQAGPHPGYQQTRVAAGKLQFDLWGLDLSSFEDPGRWAALKTDIAAYGLRNSLLIAIAPTATIASICGVGECIEPQVSNLFKRETLSGEFLQINRYLVAELQRRGLWNQDMADQIRRGQGSVQGIEQLPEDLRAVYRTAWELPMRSLIDMAAERGPFIDQSQSLNLFVESPNIGRLSSMYLHAWKSGLKTTYYLRSRPATRIAQTTTSKATDGTDGSGPRGGGSAPRPVAPGSETPKRTYTEAEALACSLENPESCEACQ